ncbi:PTS IIA-like nitrogen regulatory protein PtsN [Rhabdaerophilum sp. SD176]|uniref:PTS IIA-like nitrogen regulatory protein PtsN n=1 Tax=Rhabdaerophilum sp. SD176 TaxID=2983548 RepID=UPI0022C70498|nr:PTS IIA-like nitrogen regulatory protein PtsN [Rhabdaerophilum sp. SD176]MCZ8184059.1 PTS IIA-like nitrogen regulatory protein PtsN [Beijerinckiaceae bacterium]MCZ8300436.1 PTS IIA-like nitrogen regulatory protein PtsN [Beijerinckiaceae bacterium]
MTITSLITPESVLAGLKGNGKKQILQDLAGHIARVAGLNERLVFETLLQRERLGTTAIGQGIAIPHGRMAGLGRLVGFFAQLARPVDFEALDGEPVDLVFVLLAPEDAGADHLQALARIARLFRAPGVPQKLRQTDDAAAIYAILTSETTSRAA